jgi:hypothetical protein
VRRNALYPRRFQLILACVLALLALDSNAYGDLTQDGDLCTLKVGFMVVRLGMYQRGAAGERQRVDCENVPTHGRTFFVFEYLHETTGSMPVEVRVIHDGAGIGEYASNADIADIEDLSPDTVFLQSEVTLEQGALVATHDFKERGDYIAIVRSRHTGSGKTYQGVFFFRVGETPDWGLLPLIAILIIGVQAAYWVSQRRGSHITRMKDES